jgi:hypothetical protein
LRLFFQNVFSECFSEPFSEVFQKFLRSVPEQKFFRSVPEPFAETEKELKE